MSVYYQLKTICSIVTSVCLAVFHFVTKFTRALNRTSAYKGKVKGIGSILFLKNGLKKKFAEKIIKIISEVIIMRYVQL
jgi:hypothetical protein